MLKSKNCCWYKYSCLFTVSCGFKSRPDGNLRFSESHITAYKAVHRMFIFHIFLYGTLLQKAGREYLHR